MCMENLETFATQYLISSFPETNILLLLILIFPLLFPDHKKITDAILTTFWCLFFMIWFTTTQGQGEIFHREAHWLKEEELACLEKFTLQQSRSGVLLWGQTEGKWIFHLLWKPSFRGDWMNLSYGHFSPPKHNWNAHCLMLFAQR